MNDAVLIDYTLRALLLVLMLSLPPVIVASIFGILVSLIQAVTQIQDQTLSFAVKLVVVVITIVLTAYWIGGEIFHYAQSIFDHFPEMVK